MTDAFHRRIRARRGAAFAFVVLAATVGSVVWVQAADAAIVDIGLERVVAFDARYAVTNDGSMVVTETIDYDFGVVPRHGIQRDLVVKQRFDSSHDRVYPFSVLSVSASAGTPAQWRVLDLAGGMKRIRIGDPNRTITGRHRYVLRYRLGGVLNRFDGRESELFWNVTGDQWQVPIDATSVQVATPSPASRVRCFVGTRGSKLTCESARLPRAGSTGPATFTNGQLAPGSGLTVVVGFPSGAVAPQRILRERWTFGRAFAVTALTVSTAAVLFAGAVALVLALAWRRGRDRRAVGSAIDTAFPSPGGPEESVPLFGNVDGPVQFEPPDHLRPGQIGTLVDERANPLDVTATVVDLAARGYLSIEELPSPHRFGKTDWTLTRRKDPDGLLPYERALVDGLFESGDTVKVSALRNKFAQSMKKVQDALYDDVVTEGWFVRRPDRVRAFWTGIGFGALVVAGGVAFVLARFTHLGLLGVPLVLGALALVVAARWMPSRTAKGTGTLVRAMGFRRFMVESEKERARFAERRNLFSEYLPYAVVFGVTEKWAHAFAGLDGEVPAPSWYVSSHPFEIAAFAHAVDGFTVASAGTLTSTPGGSGSSGFSGGSAGGGGGGGGGGSW